MVGIRTRWTPSAVVPQSQVEKFCQRCGHRLATKSIDRKVRPYCPSCGHIVFLDPKLAAVVLVTMDDRLVLVRRAIEPALGRWSFPSGYVDRGESVEAAAVREVKEETGLDIELTLFIGLYSRSGSPVVLAAYAAEVAGGELQPGEEVIETGLFEPERLPALPFPHDGQILRDWRSRALNT